VAYSLYGKQTPEEQQMVFDKTPDVQKVIFSTDIAETSVTIDGVKFIVDSGMTKNLVFDSARNITSLKVWETIFQLSNTWTFDYSLFDRK
jgi:HrpA-like RNA helicase